jgi:hypothetical protein
MNIVLKKAFCAILFCIVFSTTILVAQTAYQPDGLVKKVVTGVQIDLSSVTIKDNDGKTLDASTAFPMMQSGKYTIESYVDEQDQIKEIVLRPNPDGKVVTTYIQDSENNSGNESDLKKELEDIRLKDQTLRMISGCVSNTFENFPNKEGYINYFRQLMVQEDRKNQERVMQIIDENGWIGISQVGFLANNALFLVIQHASVEILEKYFPLLKESVDKGESQPADMALMDDRIRMYRKQRQLYGSQTTTIDGKTYVWPIEDPANVDERRKSVQLPPLADYLKLAGLSYPQDELPAELF